MRLRPKIVLVPVLMAASCTPVPVGADTGPSAVGQYQQQPSWCVPASAATALNHMGAHTDQAVLAAAMGTTPADGTSDPDRVAQAMDRYSVPLGFGYQVDPDGSDPTTLADDLNYDLNGLRQDPVILAWFSDLPWNRGSASTAGHALVVTAFDPASGQVVLWDPWQPTGGTHVIALAALAQDLQTASPILRVSRV